MKLNKTCFVFAKIVDGLSYKKTYWYLYFSRCEKFQAKSTGILSMAIFYTIYAQNEPLENNNNHKIICTQKFL